MTKKKNSSKTFSGVRHRDAKTGKFISTRRSKFTKSSESETDNDSDKTIHTGPRRAN